MKELRILLVSGGSGGHVYPLVAVSESLKSRAYKARVSLKLMMLGGSFIERAAKESGLAFKTIPTGKLRRYFSFDNFADIGRFLIGLVQSLWHIFLFMPDVVFTKGGGASLAPALIAKLFFIPIFIHESDSVPGLANRVIGRMADKVFLSFESAGKYFPKSKVIFTGNPVRANLAQGDPVAARNYFNLAENIKTILVLGGSQGAMAINNVIVSGIVVLTEKYNIIHQCGETQYESVKKATDNILAEGGRQYSEIIRSRYRLYPFLDRRTLAMAYAIADTIISRGGAGGLFEIAQVGKPAIIIPILQSSGNHQYLNALEFSLHGGYLLEEPNFSQESLVREIESLLDPESYAQASQKIKLFATPNAADIIAEELLK